MGRNDATRIEFRPKVDGKGQGYRMRSKLAVLVILAVLSTVGPLHARGARGITEAPYRSPVVGASVAGATAYFYDCLNQLGCARIPLERGERYASLQVSDASGQAVWGSIYLMPGGTNIGQFCSSTEEPVPTLEATEILVHVIPGTCADGTSSVVTTGTVKAVLSRRP